MLRSSQDELTAKPAVQVDLRIAPPQPFRLDLTALALVRRPNNLIDTWREGTYRRWVPAGEPAGSTPVQQFLLEVRAAGAGSSGSQAAHGAEERQTRELLVRATGRFDEQRLAALAERAVRHIFGFDFDAGPFQALASQNERLSALASSLEGLRPPRYPSLFQALLNAVPCQQVTLVLGLRLLESLARKYGVGFDLAPTEFESLGPLPLPAATALAAADPADLTAAGLSGAKARTLIELATETVEARLDLEALRGAPSDVVSARLQELFGIGRWTSDYVLLRGLGRLDVFPYGDSGARNGLARFMGVEGKPSYEWVADTVAQWQPYAGYVYLHLLVSGMLRSGAFGPL